jgi:rhodanese-related sulfurtransferase
LWRSSGAIRMSFGPLADEALIAEACRRIERCGEALRASCLIPSEHSAAPQDGVVQLGVDGACSWMVMDAASRSCVVIDPLPELSPRIASYVRCQDYQVRAILSTSVATGTGESRTRSELAAALGRQFAGGGADEYGWPAGGLALGRWHLACMQHADGARSYLLSAAPDGAAQFVFCASAHQPGLPKLLSQDTLLCPTRDADNHFCTSQRALSCAEFSAADAGLQLHASELDAFLRAYPAALLIDVREPYEFAATAALARAGRVAHSVPLSQLSGRASEWLRGEPVPLVFFCRSGNRSLKAAELMRRLGYHQAYNLSGGLALAPLAIAA